MNTELRIKRAHEVANAMRVIDPRMCPRVWTKGDEVRIYFDRSTTVRGMDGSAHARLADGFVRVNEDGSTRWDDTIAAAIERARAEVDRKVERMMRYANDKHRADEELQAWLRSEYSAEHPLLSALA